MEGEDLFSLAAINKYATAVRKAESQGIKVRALWLCNPHNPLGSSYLKKSRSRCCKYWQSPRPMLSPWGPKRLYEILPGASHSFDLRWDLRAISFWCKWLGCDIFHIRFVDRSNRTNWSDASACILWDEQGKNDIWRMLSLCWQVGEGFRRSWLKIGLCHYAQQGAPKCSHCNIVSFNCTWHIAC